VTRVVLAEVFRRWRRWDRRAAQRVTRYVANSEATRERIARCLERDAEVVHPPVEVHRFAPGARGDHFVVLSELMAHKRLAVAVEAFNALGLPLVVVGDGPDGRRLRSLAGPNVRFEGRVPDERVRDLLATARALVVPSTEEFGIAAVEAQAAGAPVVALREGGLRESVVEDVTGVFFDTPDPAALAAAVRRLEEMTIDPARCVENARRFAPERFAHAMRRVVGEAVGAAHAGGVAANGNGNGAVTDPVGEPAR
jgi:glycosyltransferase involved in cell wall biosynthesis